MAATRVGTLVPNNRRAVLVRAVNDHLVTGEGVAKDVREIVPDLGAVKAVGKVGLGLVGEETVSLAGDLEGAATGLGVTGELLNVGVVARRNSVGVRDVAANRPEGNLEVAVVADDSVAYSRDSAGEPEGSGGDDGSLAEHFEGIMNESGFWFERRLGGCRYR